jgi:hypothetical protein
VVLRRDLTSLGIWARFDHPLVICSKIRLPMVFYTRSDLSLISVL